MRTASGSPRRIALLFVAALSRLAGIVGLLFAVALNSRAIRLCVRSATAESEYDDEYEDDFPRG